jgi:hypothetical protein
MNPTTEALKMDRGPRNKSLLASIGDKNPFKKAAEAALSGIGHDFQIAMEELARNPNKWSPEKRLEEKQKHLQDALSKRRDAIQKPIDKYHVETEATRALIKRPSHDRTDLVAAMLRKELRDLARTMTPGQRAGKLVGPDRDINFIDALAEMPPWASGIDLSNPNERAQYEEATASRVRDLNPSLLDTIAAREGNEREALMVANMLRGDLQNDYGLDDFEAIAKPIESRAAPAPDHTKPPTPPEQSQSIEAIWARFDDLVAGAASAA